MQDDNQEPRKPFFNNWLIGIIAFTVAVFMFASIIYRFSLGN